MKKNNLMGNINVVFEKGTDHTDLTANHAYLVDDFLIESVEVKIKTVSGEVVTLNGLDWDVLLDEDGEC